MARVVRLDTDEEIGYLVDLYGPLEPGRTGCFFDAWQYADGSLHAEPPSEAAETCAMPLKISMPVERPEQVECVLLVTPTYLDFMLDHPAFRPLSARRRRRTSLWRKG